jgi:hypothetical protein
VGDALQRAVSKMLETIKRKRVSTLQEIRVTLHIKIRGGLGEVQARFGDKGGSPPGSNLQPMPIESLLPLTRANKNYIYISF